ncbi:hypothetical protein [Arthrobacter sp. efr-133-TYG-118]|uniref:hypothetical protein n=1 Tax=Arthrobacter sp. efr-133-TYG-118 TaxID=3040279 RepID=UPI00254AB948|nr:hypothetical protein [Arthrobacter sp. efr-133-TYG-118]
MNTQLIARHYPAVLKYLGITVASCSAISAGLLWAAPPPDGLRVLDPVATKATILILLALLGVLLPLAAALVPGKHLRFAGTVFASSAMANALALSPMIVVPFQNATSLVAVIGAIALAVAGTPALHDPIEDRDPEL